MDKLSKTIKKLIDKRILINGDKLKIRYKETAITIYIHKLTKTK